MKIGDEALTSAALEKMRRNNVHIADAGVLGIVGRYWNCPTQHPQRPFAYFRDCFLLHLPRDKRFLASLAGRKSIDRAAFFQEYAAWRNSFRKKVGKLILTVQKPFHKPLPYKVYQPN